MLVVGGNNTALAGPKYFHSSGILSRRKGDRAVEVGWFGEGHGVKEGAERAARPKVLLHRLGSCGDGKPRCYLHLH